MRLLVVAAAIWAAYRILEENRRPHGPVGLLPSPERIRRDGLRSSSPSKV